MMYLVSVILFGLVILTVISYIKGIFKKDKQIFTNDMSEKANLLLKENLNDALIIFQHKQGRIATNNLLMKLTEEIIRKTYKDTGKLGW